LKGDPFAMDKNMGLLSSLENMSDGLENLTLLGDSKAETELFLTALESECTPDEYQDLMENAAIEMAMYGLIADADVATEATKTIVKMNKTAKYNAIEHRAAVRLAAKNDDVLYAKYAKGRRMMIEAREGIYTKYGAKAKTEAKKIIQNSKRRASAMGSSAGKSITDKMDAQIAKATAHSK